VVGRLVAAGFCVRRRCPGEGFLLDREVGVQVDLGGADLLVPEPERDHGRVDAGVEESHRGGVSQDVWCDRLGPERRACRGGVRRVFREPVLDGVCAERPAGGGGEQRIVGSSFALACPDAQHGGGLLSEWRDALFSAFADAVDVRVGAEADVAEGEAGQLRDAQAGLRGEQDDGVITATDRGRSVGRGEQRVDSGSVRNVMSAWSRRLAGIARTRWIVLACSGCLSAAYLNSERIAASRVLRVRTLFARSCSRWSRNAPINAPSRSSISSGLGCLAVCWAANASGIGSVLR